jgi:hypothetical protein
MLVAVLINGIAVIYADILSIFWEVEVTKTVVR